MTKHNSVQEFTHSLVQFAFDVPQAWLYKRVVMVEVLTCNTKLPN